MRITGMKINEISEVEKIFIIRLVDGRDDFEDITVNIPSECLNPQSPHFTHCKVDINMTRNRTINNHIQYLETICKGLKDLQKKLEKNRHENNKCDD